MKIVGGTFRPDRANPDEPTPSADLPEPPESLTERAAAIFRDLVAVLEEMGIASSSDAWMLANLALRLEEVEICTAIIEDGGRVYVSACERDEAGNVVSRRTKTHPAVGQRNEAMRHAQSLLAQFGLSPAARAKVSPCLSRQT